MNFYKSLATFVFFLLYGLVSKAQISRSQYFTYNFDFHKAAPLSKNRTRSELVVIDKRANKEDLGYVRTGALNRSAPVIPAQQIDTMLSAYYGKVKGTQT